MQSRLRSVLLSALVVVLVGASARAQGTLRIGMDAGGEDTWSTGAGSATWDTDPGLFLGFDVPSSRSDTVETGFGVELQLPRTYADDSSQEFSYVSLYLYGKFLTAPGNTSPSLVARLGYNAFQGNDNYTVGMDTAGGVCAAFGLSVPIQPGMEVELMYAVNNGVVDPDGADIDAEYSRVRVALSIAF